MIRLFMAILVIAVALLQLIDRLYIRTLTAKKEVVAISVADARVFPLKIETQEIVNNESVIAFAEKSIVKILNFRPGKLMSHLEEKDIESLFINEKYYDTFVQQLKVWANTEFRVNNISIKEAIATDVKLARTPAVAGRSFRIFEVSARVPTYDRAVGDSELSMLLVKVYMVYLGPESGTGLYKVKIDII